MLDIIAALLRIAQIGSKARRSRFFDVDLTDIANRIVEAHASVAEDEGQRLTARIAPGVSLKGDKNLLTQMMGNLVENAIRHCPSGTSIAVELHSYGVDPCLIVSDSGPGIPPEERGKVVRRLYRLEKSRTTPGSGLGLALVKAIADLHAATLDFSDNSPGLRVALRFGSATRR